MQIKIWHLGALALVVSSATSCSKPSDLGLGLVNGNYEPPIYTDTVTFNLTTERADTIMADKNSWSFCGEVNDPVFGKTYAETYMSFRLPRVNVDFADCTADSLVLYLPYSTVEDKHVGDYTNNQTWEIYRLDEALNSADDYFNHNQLNATTSITESGPITFKPNFYKDFVTLEASDTLGGVGDAVTMVPLLRVRLSMALAQELLDADPTVYNSTNNFQAFFHGLAVRPVGSSNTALIALSQQTSYAKMTLYYTDSANFQRMYDFNSGVNVGTTSSTYLTHDYSSVTHILDNQPSDTLVYVQGIQGTRIKVSFPNVTYLKNKIINRAELILEVAGTDVDRDQYIHIPTYLDAGYIDDANEYQYISDFPSPFTSAETALATVYGGFPRFEDNDRVPRGRVRRYRINLTNHFQKMISGELPNYILLANAYSRNVASLNPEQAVFGNERSFIAKPVFKLTYTNYPE